MPKAPASVIGLPMRLALGYGFALLVIVLDQWTKHWASTSLTYRIPERVTAWFDLMLAHNTGAAFSFLAGAGGWQRWFFALVAVAVSAVIAVWIVKQRQGPWWLLLGLGAILGGGIGNLIDRMRLGHVVDFLSVHYRDWYWPAFNLADSAITLGVILLLLDMLRSHRAGAPAPQGE
ncbi:MAG: signal peptidase II [Halieaceae bacterium]|nr:signal peptidase II [Halieaceae bacterium]